MTNTSLNEPLRCWVIPRHGRLPERRVEHTTLEQIAQQLSHDFIAALENNIESMFDSVDHRLFGLKLYTFEIKNITIEFDETMWRSRKAGWYGWIEFAMKDEKKNNRLIGSSIDIVLADMYGNVDISSLKNFREKHGEPVAQQVIDKIREFIKVSNASTNS